MKTFKGNSACEKCPSRFYRRTLEHTVSVAKLCLYYCGTYSILNKDLLITAALLHDIGKTKELSAFPMNDYTDDGQLLGIL